MISGMYMGELIRQVLLDLMKDDLIFFGCNREMLLERGSFYTRFASEIESDPVGDYTRYVFSQQTFMLHNVMNDHIFKRKETTKCAAH